MNEARTLDLGSAAMAIPLQPASLDIWSRKYQLRGADGTEALDDLVGVGGVVVDLARHEAAHEAEEGTLCVHHL
jgi:hypothetical protein